ncbi:hypothetical protein ACWESM_12380 [Nocardia sp. NPDC003999]
MTTSTWDAALALRVGQSVKALREAETPKASAAKLADRSARYGYALTKAQISDLELGRKKTVTLAELIVLAATLGVPPVQLIYPELPDGEVEVWPGFGTTSVTAAQWFSGEITARDIADVPLTEKSTNSRISAAREYERLKEAVTSTARQAVDAQFAPEALEAMRAAKNRLDEMREQFRANGWPVHDGD